MVTIDNLKDYLNIDFNDDNVKLQRKLDASISRIERYTNLSLVAKTVNKRVYGTFEFYGSPIISITGTPNICYNETGFTATGNGIIQIELGATDNPMIDEAVLKLAGQLYEDIEIDSVNLPLDIQLLLNQFRNDSFLS